MLDCTTISKAFAVPWKERNTKFFLKSLQPKHVCGLKQDRKALMVTLCDVPGTSTLP